MHGGVDLALVAFSFFAETLDRDVLPMPLLPFLLDPVRARAPTVHDQLARPAGVLPDVDAAALLELAASICTSCHLNPDQTGYGPGWRIAAGVAHRGWVQRGTSPPNATISRWSVAGC